MEPHDQFPVAPAVTVHRIPPASDISTVAPASAVPETVWAAIVTVDPLTGDRITGATGGVVSIVNELEALSGLMLPDPSEAVAAMT